MQSVQGKPLSYCCSYGRLVTNVLQMRDMNSSTFCQEEDNAGNGNYSGRKQVCVTPCDHAVPAPSQVTYCPAAATMEEHQCSCCAQWTRISG